MSDFLAAAAQALNAPEVLVKRSAEARAKATGTPVDDILAAWAGGQTVAAAPPATPATAPAPEPERTPPAAPAAAPAPAPAPATSPVAPPEGAPTPATGPASVVVTAGPVEPPVLVGRTENPLRALAAATGLVALLLLIGFIAPALPSEGNGVYTSAVPLSAAGIEGRDIYLREGCASCHTQQVRPIVADAGLGGVTVSDSNQILGSRRYGPDLAHIGSRIEDDADLAGVLQGADHPSYAGLGDSDLTALTAYLSESK
jgi:hypothetical protein